MHPTVSGPGADEPRALTAARVADQLRCQQLAHALRPGGRAAGARAKTEIRNRVLKLL